MDRFLEIADKKISYSDVGKGPTIVFLHGWMSSKSVFQFVVEHLSKKYRCVSIDIPGFGKSDFVGRITIKKIPYLIHKVIRKLKIKKFYLVGTSFGGALSLIYADIYKKEIKKIALISPFINFKQFSRLVYFALRYVAPYVLKKRILTPIYKIIKIIVNYDKDGDKTKLYRDFINERVKRKAVNAFRIAFELSSMDLYSVLRKVRKDILFIYGSRDTLLSIKPLQSVFGVLNNVHLAIFEDVRHYVFTYNPKELSEKIDLFFSDNNVK